MSERCHILILTPDQRRRDRHRSVLEKAGHTTAPARVLQDALTRIAEQSPDVVLMDLWVEDAPAQAWCVRWRNFALALPRSPGSWRDCRHLQKTARNIGA